MALFTYGTTLLKRGIRAIKQPALLEYCKPFLTLNNMQIILLQTNNYNLCQHRLRVFLTNPKYMGATFYNFIPKNIKMISSLEKLKPSP